MSEPAKQGDPVVLLVHGDSYLELMSKIEGMVEVIDPAGLAETVMLTEIQEAGYIARPALKLIKTDGTWVYMARGSGGLDVYQGGKFFPSAPIGQQRVRNENLH